MDEIGLWNGLDRISRFAPCSQAAYDDKGIKSLFSEQMRHTGAGRFADSGAV
jgi:hypothetical protein